MAQDLLEMGMDKAVMADENGFYGVYYDTIDVDFIEVE